MKVSLCRLCSIRGHVLPQAFKVTLPCALITLVLKLLDRTEHWLLGGFTGEWHIETAGFTTFSSLLAFLVVFRTSEAYSRYWEGWQGA
mmetsp:Transcript_4847/g.5407  ORF Transcript_4847/g.5407 Transcript_4847/m.5407 type:complete len:88 (+) Transcript_4847:110-373(+)